MKARTKILACLGMSLMGYMAVSATPYGLGTYGSCTYNQTCTISMATSGTVSLNSTPTVGGVYTINNDEVTVTTNSSDGYILTLESSGNGFFAPSLIAPGFVTIDGVSGTPQSPAALSNNSFGYRVDGEAGFGPGPTTAIQNQSSNALTFAALPVLGNPATVKTNTIGAPTGETTNVWYGTKVDSTQQNGSYTRTVIYTAIMQ